MSVLFCRFGMGVCLSLTFILSATANSTQDARRAIQSAYVGMDKATDNRNTSAYSVYLDPNIIGIDEKGKETDGKAKTLQALSQAFALVSAARSNTKIKTFTLQKGGAVVTTDSTLSFSGTKNGQPFVIKSENQVRDFWNKSGGRWLLRQERVISNTQTLNGQPVPPAP